MQCQRFLCTIFLSIFVGIGNYTVSKADPLSKDPEPILLFDHQKGGYGDYLAAYHAAQAEDSLMASRLYNVILEKDPQNISIRQRAFYHNVIAGNPAAIPLAKLESKDPISALVLGNQAVLKKDWPTALASFANPPSDSLGQISYTLLQAWSLYGNHQPEQAYALLEKNMNSSPAAGIYMIHYGIMESLAHHDDKAGQLFQQANQLFDGGDLLLTRVYGNWLIRHHREGKADAVLDRMLELLPFLQVSKADLRAGLNQFPIHTVQEGMAQVYLEMASLIQQDMTNRANSGNTMNDQIAYKVSLHTEQIFLRFALQLNPNLSEAKIMLSGILAEEKHLEAAQDILLPFPVHDSLVKVMQLRVAQLNTLLKSFKQAEKAVQDLLVTCPKQAGLWQILGDIYLDQKKYKEATSAYSKVIELNREKGQKDWTSLFIRANAYEKLDQWQKAEQDLRKALEIAPNEPLLLNYLGYSWALRQQHLKEAQTLLQKAVDIAPDDAPIRDSLGWVMVLNNQLPEAIKELELAAETIPQDPELNYHLGMAYWKVGRQQEAINQWNVALTCSPDAKMKNLILKALQRVPKKYSLSLNH